MLSLFSVFSSRLRPMHSAAGSLHGSKLKAGIVVMLGAMLLTSCSDSEDMRFPPYDNTKEVKAYWKSKPDFSNGKRQRICRLA